MTFDQFRARLQSAAETRLHAALRREMATTVEDAVGRAKARLGGDVLMVRTGNLRRSITGEVVRADASGIEGAVMAGGGPRAVRYAAIHEYGGTIRPVNAKALAIPLKRAQNPNKSAKYASPRQVQGLTLIWPKGSPRGWLVKRKKRSTEFWFKLVRKVTIPERPYVRPSVREAVTGLRGRVHDAFTDALGLP